MRTFETGATRNPDTGKHDYEGFLSPLVLERFGEYMTKHRHLEDGTLRDSDNWQKGIPRSAYLKSAFRHFMDVWKWHRGYGAMEEQEEALCALLFNVMGYLHETIRERYVAHPIRSVLPKLSEELVVCVDCEAVVERVAGPLGGYPAIHPCVPVTSPEAGVYRPSAIPCAQDRKA